MVNSEGISRRAYLAGIGFICLEPELLSAAQRAHQSARSGSAAFEFFDPATATGVEALAAQIIPSDGAPGAREAGVIYFIDRAPGNIRSGEAAALP